MNLDLMYLYVHINPKFSNTIEINHILPSQICMLFLQTYDDNE
jgi:hypothetical protein